MNKPQLRKMNPYVVRLRERIPDSIRSEVLSAFSRPKRTPIQYWRWVLSEAPRGSIAEAAAREALAKLDSVPDRIPGEDDE